MKKPITKDLLREMYRRQQQRRNYFHDKHAYHLIMQKIIKNKVLRNRQRNKQARKTRQKQRKVWN
jgi:hypothetical protein